MDKNDTTSKSQNKNGIIFIVGISLISLSVVIIITISLLWNNKDTNELRGRFGVMLDAGGSGTRMHVYEYKNDHEMVDIFYKKCENKGLANLAGKDSFIKDSINRCLKEAEKAVPESVVKETPLYLGATGGMRILKIKNATVYNNLWTLLHNILQNGSFPVKMATALSGRQEGAYSWATINSLLNRKAVTSGLFEVGSSSFQIAFEELNSSHVPEKYRQYVSFNKKKYQVYAHSYLCFGKAEFTRRYQAKLFKESNYSAVVYDPCNFDGFNETLQVDKLWSSPCVESNYAHIEFGESFKKQTNIKEFKMVGTSNYSECLNNINTIFNQSTCTDSCSINNMHPAEAKGIFTAIGGGVYYSSKFLNVAEPATIITYRNATERLCSMSYDQITKLKGFSRYAKDYCLSDVYNYYLMNNILKLSDQGKIQFEDKINDQAVTWTLGSMSNKTNEMSPAVIETTRELSSGLFYGLIVLAILMILLGVSLICHYRFNLRTKNKTQNNMYI